MSIRTFARVAIAVSTVLWGTSATAAEPIRVHGSTTVDAILMTPFQTRIEQEGGVPLAIVTSNSGQGLNELSRGVADIAMISAPFADVVARLKETANRTLDPTQFAIHELGRAHIRFVVGRDNPIASLTKEQLADILTGKITRWSAVGGPNQPVTVVTEKPNGAMRTEIIAKLLGGQELAVMAMTVGTATEAPEMIHSTPGAIGFVSSATLKSAQDKVKVVETGVDLTQDLIIVTAAAPKPEVAKAAEAIVKVAATALHD